MPKLTIITPTFNSAQTLEDTIVSILKQTYTDWEHIIIDGSSTDDTLSLIQRYPHIRVVSEKDKGIYDAMNKGIKMAEGEWVYFLGSNDVFFDDQVLNRIFEDHKNTVLNSDYVYGNVLWGETGMIFNGAFTISKLYHGNICHQALFVKKSVFDKIGNFSLRYPALADWYFNTLCFFDSTINKTYLSTLVSKFDLHGMSGRTEDSFETEKKQLFDTLVYNIPLKDRLKFQLDTDATVTISDKLKYAWKLFLYLIIYSVTSLKRGKLA